MTNKLDANGRMTVDTAMEYYLQSRTDLARLEAAFACVGTTAGTSIVATPAEVMLTYQDILNSLVELGQITQEDRDTMEDLQTDMLAALVTGRAATKAYDDKRSNTTA